MLSDMLPSLCRWRCAQPAHALRAQGTSHWVHCQAQLRPGTLYVAQETIEIMLCHSKAPRLLLTRVEALSRLSYASMASAMATTRLSPSVQTLRVLAGQWAGHREAKAAGSSQMLPAWTN